MVSILLTAGYGLVTLEPAPEAAALSVIFKTLSTPFASSALEALIFSIRD